MSLPMKEPELVADGCRITTGSTRLRRRQEDISSAAYLAYLVDEYFACRPLRPTPPRPQSSVAVARAKTEEDQGVKKEGTTREGMSAAAPSSPLAGNSAHGDLAVGQRSFSAGTSAGEPLETLGELDPCLGSRCAALLLLCKPRGLAEQSPLHLRESVQRHAQSPRLLAVVAAGVSIVCWCEHGVRLSRLRLFDVCHAVSESCTPAAQPLSEVVRRRCYRREFYAEYLTAYGDLQLWLRSQSSSPHHHHHHHHHHQIYSLRLSSPCIAYLLNELILRHHPCHPAVVICVRVLERFFVACCSDVRLGSASKMALGHADEPHVSVAGIALAFAESAQSFAHGLDTSDPWDLRTACAAKDQLSGHDVDAANGHDRGPSSIACTATRADYCGAILVAAVRFRCTWWLRSVLAVYCPRSVADIIADTHAPDLEGLCSSVAHVLCGEGLLCRSLYLALQMTPEWRALNTVNGKKREQGVTMEGSKKDHESLSLTTKKLSSSVHEETWEGSSLGRALDLLASSFELWRRSSGVVLPQPPVEAPSSQSNGAPSCGWGAMKLAVKDVLDNGQTGGLSYACLLTAKHYAVELAACTAQKEGLEYGACRPADDVDRERTRDENDEFRERGGLTYPRDRDDGSTERRDNVALRAVGGDAPGPEEAEVRWADLPPLAPDEVALYIRQDGTSKLELILRHNGA